ncbi:cell division protein ZapA [Marivivens donghaensis]|uniref:cell division protein ZapA n=1 Tax=Marivivens donghaensis TaxID=1699413 RepID=UPI00201F935D|nr:cell division protein ZapA [Marivivens donghaensis]MCL7407999.1 cell division protein ZapA [Marivivens donghaensis]MDN3704022.1 cell division protein ZapA [Marivivens donghaensis]
MPQVEIKIGGRSFEVACQEGEESFLQSAAALLDAEASSFAAQAGRMPESQLLLMSGLLLADKTVAIEDRLREAEDKIAELELKVANPKEVAVPVVPTAVTDTLKELAARAEALADEVDDKLKA